MSRTLPRLEATPPDRLLVARDYLSYDFTNVSKDISGLFATACDLVGVGYRVACWRGMWHVRVNRRASVALMLQKVGVKSRATR